MMTMERTAYFAGSFNPFTRGHADIVQRALNMFDRVVIGIGFNINKPHSAAATDERLSTIRALYADNPRVGVEAYSGLTADAAHRAGATVIVRGVRDTRDFEYERQMAEVNRDLFGIDTIFIPADPKWSALSSSMVRELDAHGVDTARFIPDNNNM